MRRTGPRYICKGSLDLSFDLNLSPNPEPIIPMSNVVMPQMGESVAEGTIVRWIKRVGDTVDKDEPLFEISTDKVDAEIPAPDAGTLLEIRVLEGETVPVHTVVAIIGVAGAARAVDDGRSSLPAAVTASQPTAHDVIAPLPVAAGRQPVPAVRPNSLPLDRLRSLSSPVVRAMAKTHGIDISQLRGSGVSGRVTKHDIETVVEGRSPERVVPRVPVYQPGDNVRLEKMTVMRRRIADHMVNSLRTSAHIYSAYEVDFSRIDTLRRQHKVRYEAAGANLTYTAFVAKAAADAIREFPYVNASLDGDTIVYKNDINLGIAVALEQGLIVPVIRNADQKSVMELCRLIQDLAQRARMKQLKVDDVEGGTFTLTNPGIFGGLWGLPIISQPQVAILAVGAIEKRAVVVDDQIVARPMCYLTLGYDHRLVDGADGGRFLQALKDRLENFTEALL
jgi:pyruvate dehydrogenase E2 component (dihydrolipoamide acetyltransferase)